jgi:anthranilate synthase component 1
MPSPTRDEFIALVARERKPGQTLAVPISVRLLADQLTPVLAYRRLVAPDERTAPSFLLESVEGGERQGRHSILGAQPIAEIVASEHQGDHSTVVRVWEPASSPAMPLLRRAVGRPGRANPMWGVSVEEVRGGDPLAVARAFIKDVRLVRATTSARDGPPSCVLGGLFGFVSYDTVRYAEPEKLAFAGAPPDDRGLPDLHLAFYDGVVVFDHVDKLVHVVQLAIVSDGDDPGARYDQAARKAMARVEQISRHARPLALGQVPRDTPRPLLPSNLTREQHAAMVARAREYIAAGDIFQVVLGQRFERRSKADPFDVYRALRAVNPSPYMVYMQGPGTILVASSPEILCRVRAGAGLAAPMVVTNRPLAGTRRRGATPEEDAALERELLADHKERAEHIMLVDLGRNDLGRVAQSGTIRLDRIMDVERYSHVMHISSTITGALREGLDCWDALRATLPVGTISGAPKIRAMQIIDELEPVRRGPYGGGMGYVGLDGQMDIALALRTIVVPVTQRAADGTWLYHLQAAGGIVADSNAEDEYQETINKAAAMARAIDLAESAFGGPA